MILIPELKVVKQLEMLTSKKNCIQGQGVDFRFGVKMIPNDFDLDSIVKPKL